MSEFGDYGNYRGNFPDFPKLFFTTFEKPKHYDYIPESFKLNWEDPHKFIPDRMVSNFNQKMFINYVHRECFNSCVASGNILSDSERECYNNCKNKHLSSLGTFKDILVERRRWKGWRNFLSMKEFSRTPEEIATDFPTDPLVRHKLLDAKEEESYRKQRLGLREALNSEFDKEEQLTIFDFYLNGRYSHDSRVGKENRARHRKDYYNEYKELNEKYGAQVVDLLKQKVDLRDWKDVPGDDYQIEEESETTSLNKNETPSLGEAASDDSADDQ